MNPLKTDKQARIILRQNLTFIFIFFFLSISSELWSQKTNSITTSNVAKIESTFPEKVQELIKKLEREQNAQEKLDIYKSICFQIKNANTEGLYHYAKEMLQFAEASKNTEGYIDALCFRAVALMEFSRFNEAEENLRKGIQLAEESNYQYGLTKSYNALANCFFLQGKFTEGLDIANTTLQKLVESEGEAHVGVYSTIGRGYAGQGIFNKAIENYIHALRINERFPDKNREMVLLCNLAISYLHNEDVVRAKKAAEQSLELIEPNVHLVSEAQAKNIIGSVAWREGNFIAAKHAFHDCVRIYETLERNAELATIFGNLGAVYAMEENADSTLYWSNKGIILGEQLNMPIARIVSYSNAASGYNLLEQWDTSFALQFKALELSESSNILVYISQSLLGISDTYEKKGELDKALEYYKKHHEKDKELFDIAKEKAIQDTRTEFETDQIAAELQQQKKTNRLYIGSATTILIIASILAYLLIMNRRRRLQLNKVNQELRKAKQRIEVLLKEAQHRIKNNLMFLAGVLDLQSLSIVDKDAQVAIAEGKNRVEAIGILHQRLLYQDIDPTKINIKHYLTDVIQQTTALTTQENVDVLIQIEDVSIDVDEAKSLGIIVQELITNSLKHRIIHRPMVIKITFTVNERSELQYEDNGLGSPDNIIFSEADSFGLRLINLLKEQLNGTINVQGDQGFHFTLQY